MSAPGADALSLSCMLCKEEYPLRELGSHLAQMHAEYVPHKCSKCDFFSISAMEMAQHGEEAQHRVVINEAFDDYKDELVRDLLADCWKKAHGERPMPTLSPSSYIHGHIDTPIIKSEDGDEEYKEEVEQSQTGPNKKTHFVRTATCQHPDCGIVVEVRGRASYSTLRAAQARHLEEYHVRAHIGVNFRCPIKGCPRSASAGVKNRLDEYRGFRVLANHIGKSHRISHEQKDDLESLNNRVNAALRDLRPICFPPDGNKKVAMAQTGVSKPIVQRTIKCHLVGCGAELPLTASPHGVKDRHIEVHHVRNQPGFSFHCPVEGCPKSALHITAGNKEQYRSIRSIAGHIKTCHHLTPEEQKAYDELSKRVLEAVKKLRKECFP